MVTDDEVENLMKQIADENGLEVASELESIIVPRQQKKVRIFSPIRKI